MLCSGPPFCKSPSPCLLVREHGGSSGGWPEHGKPPYPVRSAAPDVPTSCPVRPHLPGWWEGKGNGHSPCEGPAVGRGRRAPSYPGSVSQALSTQSLQGGCNLSSAGLGEPRAGMARDVPSGTSPSQGPCPRPRPASHSRPLWRALCSFPAPGSRTGPTKADPALTVYQSPQDSPRFTKEETRPTRVRHRPRHTAGNRAASRPQPS